MRFLGLPFLVLATFFVSVDQVLAQDSCYIVLDGKGGPINHRYDKSRPEVSGRPYIIRVEGEAGLRLSRLTDEVMAADPAESLTRLRSETKNTVHQADLSHILQEFTNTLHGFNVKRNRKPHIIVTTRDRVEPGFDNVNVTEYPVIIETPALDRNGNVYRDAKGQMVFKRVKFRLRYYQSVAQTLNPQTGHYDVVLSSFTKGGRFQELKMDYITQDPVTGELHVNTGKPKEWYPEEFLNLMWDSAAYKADPKGYETRLKIEAEHLIRQAVKPNGQPFIAAMVKKQVALQLELHKVMASLPTPTHHQKLLISNVRETLLVSIPISRVQSHREALRRHLRKIRGLAEDAPVELPEQAEFQITSDKDVTMLDPKTKEVLATYDLTDRVVEVKGDVELMQFSPEAILAYPGLSAVRGLIKDLQLAHDESFMANTGKRNNTVNLQ